MSEERQEQHHRANDLEARLHAYYGPPLQEQPLSTGSWEALHRQLVRQKNTSLSTQKFFRGRYGFSKMRRPTKRGTILPSLVQESLLHVQQEARWRGQVPPVRCKIRATTHKPSVRVGAALLIGRPTIRLSLPVDTAITLSPVELDVLLAVGFARTMLMNRTGERVLRLALALLLLISSCLAIYGIVHKTPSIDFPIAVSLYISCGVVWLYRQYRIALAADVIVVYWLGRSRVCDGFHRLAERERNSYRRRWDEPSLDDRIRRVCGTEVTARGKDLTLVR